jgi:hypothetical protein
MKNFILKKCPGLIYSHTPVIDRTVLNWMAHRPQPIVGYDYVIYETDLYARRLDRIRQ